MKKIIGVFIFMLVLTGCSNTNNPVISNNTATKSVDPDTNNTVTATPVLTETPVETTSEITSTPIPTSTPVPTATPVPEINLNGKQWDVVTFGSYYQDRQNINSLGPIEWIVLSNDGEKMLLYSRYILERMPYNEQDIEITWENCSLRNWLNNDFYNTAFNENEKKYILKTQLQNEDVVLDIFDTKQVIKCGNPTEDKVFLLSWDEILNNNYGFKEQYGNDINRRCAEAYSKYRGEYENPEEFWSPNCLTSENLSANIYWLRTNGNIPKWAMVVFMDGLADYDGRNVVAAWGVRPAIYVKVK